MYSPATTNVLDVNRAVLYTDVNMLNKARSEREALESEIEQLRDRYTYFKELFSSPQKQSELLGMIEKNAKSLIAKRDGLPPKPVSLRNATKGNEKSTKKNIAALLIWLNSQFNVANPLTKDQIEGLVDAILIEYDELWIEDVAMCFKGALLRQKNGFNTYILDVPTILGWLTTYREKKLADAENNNFNKHLMQK